MVERTLISFSSQLQLIERLQHLLYLSSSMIFISGEQGSGKSTLVEQLSNQLPNNTQEAFITLSEPISVVQMRQLIISRLFEQPLFDADDTLINIFLLLQEKQDPNIARVIVIDNANLLPESLLGELAEVIKQKSLLCNNEINFILLSDEATNKRMLNVVNGGQHNQDIATLTFKLAPLNASEANQLLKHRFEQLGYAPQIQHKDALAKQLSNCQGIPEKILLLAAELSNGDLAFDNPSWLRTRLPALLLMVLLVAIAASLGAYLYPKLIPQKVAVETIIETEELLLDEISAVGLVAEEASTGLATEALAGNWSTGDEQLADDTQLSVGEADNEERVTISDQQLLELVSFDEQSQAISSDAETIATLSEKENRITSELVEQVALAALAEKENIITQEIATQPELDRQVAKDLPVVAQPNQPSAPVVASISAAEPEPLITEPLISEPLISEPLISEASTDLDMDLVHEAFALQELEVTEPVKQAEKTELEQSPASTDEILDDVFTPASKLLAINKNSFTVQLSGMSSTKSLQEFISQHQLPRENVHLYKTIRSNKPWYVVIYGQFDNRSMANSAANELPGTLSSLGSWVKDYASVHQDLQLNEQ